MDEKVAVKNLGAKLLQMLTAVRITCAVLRPVFVSKHMFCN